MTAGTPFSPVPAFRPQHHHCLRQPPSSAARAHGLWLMASRLRLRQWRCRAPAHLAMATPDQRHGGPVSGPAIWLSYVMASKLAGLCQDQRIGCHMPGPASWLSYVMARNEKSHYSGILNNGFIAQAQGHKNTVIHRTHCCIKGAQQGRNYLQSQSGHTDAAQVSGAHAGRDDHKDHLAHAALYPDAH